MNSYVSGAFDFFGISARDCEQCIDVFRSVITAWNATIPIEMCALFPLIIAFQQKRPYDLSQETQESLKTLVQSRQGSARWQFDFPGFSNFNMSAQQETVNGFDLFVKFRKYSSRTLRESAEMSPNLAGDAWVLDKFDIERRIRSPGTRAKSFISEYPRLIRSAGRLIPSDLPNKPK
jgi:hypothetical protein